MAAPGALARRWARTRGRRAYRDTGGRRPRYRRDGQGGDRGDPPAENPRRLVLAVPVCAVQTAKTLRSAVDELVCLAAPSDLAAIGFWYEDFYQVPDDEVLELLDRARGSRTKAARPARKGERDLWRSVRFGSR